MKNKKLIIFSILGGIGTLMATVSEIATLIIGNDEQKEEVKQIAGGDDNAKEQ